MEGIIQTIIGGLFALGGVLLAHYLQEKRAERYGDVPGGRPAGVSRRSPRPRTARPAPARDRPQRRAGPPAQPSPAGPDEADWTYSASTGSAMPVWLLPAWCWSALAMVVFGIAGAFFAQWVLGYAASVFAVDLPEVSGAWLALLIVGGLWGAAYAFKGAEEATVWPEHLFGPLIPYLVVTDFGNVLGLLAATPFNVLFGWGLALGVGAAAETYLDAQLSGVVYLVFGVESAIALFAFTFSDW